MPFSDAMPAARTVACNASTSLLSIPAGAALLLLIVLCLPSALAKAAPSAPLPTPVLQSNTALANAGYYQLKWHLPGGQEPVFELQEAGQRAFEHPQEVYRGRDLASVMSGLPDGQFFYRVRAISKEGAPGPWSATVHVQVAYLPLSRAFIFFGLGALVFIATLLVILDGTRRAARERAL